MPNELQNSARIVVVSKTPIELCQFLKFGGLTDSGGQAKMAISQGLVLVNGAVETRKRRKLAVGDTVVLGGQTIMVGI
jgi:ribosome-associated protein